MDTSYYVANAIHATMNVLLVTGTSTALFVMFAAALNTFCASQDGQ